MLGEMNMFNYSVKQKTYTIQGVKVGGEPGEVPTLMVGSMFYNGDRNVSDSSRGIFNIDRSLEQIRDAEKMSEKTGLSTMIDLVAENTRAACKYLDFLIESTEIPIFLDVLSESAQIETLHYASEIGVINRIVLNSLNPHSGKGIYEAIQKTNLRSAVILAHSTRYILSTNKEPLVEELVFKAKNAGIENILIDTAVIDIPTLGISAKAIDGIKDKYGYPCGCGAHNALSSWKRLSEKYSMDAQTMVKGVINAIPTIIGADFVLFGPLKGATMYYPAVAMVDAAYSQLMMEKRIRPNKEHPRYKIG
jgi:tetrahydromethanopterin S-methyltransferase subunit H